MNAHQKIISLDDALLTKRHLLAFFSNKVARAIYNILFVALLAYHYQEIYGISPAIIQGIFSISFLISVSRPLVGYWSDTRPIFNYKRKSYAIIGNIFFLASISIFFIMDTDVQDTFMILFMVVVIFYGLGDTMMDVAYDSLALDLSINNPTSKNKIRLVMRAGVIIGNTTGYALGAFFLTNGWNIILFLILTLVIISFSCGSVINEKKINRTHILQELKKNKKAPRSNLGNSYKALIILVGTFIFFTMIADAMPDVIMEPWLIKKLHSIPEQFYVVQLIGGIISFIVLGIIGVFFLKRLNFSWMLIVLLGTSSLYYLGIAFWTPDLTAYLYWDTLKYTISMLVGLGLDRFLMDIVKGEGRGWTFQSFVIFMYGGTFLGGILGAMIFQATSMEVVLTISSLIVMIATFVLIKLFKKVLNSGEKEDVPKKEPEKETP
ncbi:MAG: MFS transporter [Promethearchaeota archaeon]